MKRKNELLQTTSKEKSKRTIKPKSKAINQTKPKLINIYKEKEEKRTRLVEKGNKEKKGKTRCLLFLCIFMRSQEYCI